MIKYLLGATLVALVAHQLYARDLASLSSLQPFGFELEHPVPVAVVESLAAAASVVGHMSMGLCNAVLANLRFASVPYHLVLSLVANETESTQRLFGDRVFLVTGASSGIGADVARELAARNAAGLVLAARRREKLELVASECRALGAQRVVVVPTDVTVQSQVDVLVEETRRAFGRLDVLVLNAGVAGQWARFDELKNIDDLERVMQINYFGYVRTLHAALPLLKQSHGHVVAVSSFYGFLIAPFQAGYCATKHAIQGFFNTVREELRADGVTVTVHMPGGISTEIQSKFRDADGTRETTLELPELMLAPSRACARSVVSAYARSDEHAFFPFYARTAAFAHRLMPDPVARLYHFLVDYYQRTGTFTVSPTPHEH